MPRRELFYDRYSFRGACAGAGSRAQVAPRGAASDLPCWMPARYALQPPSVKDAVQAEFFQPAGLAFSPAPWHRSPPPFRPRAGVKSLTLCIILPRLFTASAWFDVTGAWNRKCTVAVQMSTSTAVLKQVAQERKPVPTRRPDLS